MKLVDPSAYQWLMQKNPKPIITMLEMIKRYIRMRFVIRHELAEKWNYEIGPRVFKILEKNKDCST